MKEGKYKMDLVGLLSVIAGVLVSVSTILGSFLAVYKWLKKKAESIISNTLHKILEENITPKIEQMGSKINTLEDKVNTNEKDRLRSHIISFSEQLRSGVVPTDTSFRNIFTEHEKYKSLGGNGFEKQCIKYIEEKYCEYYNK